MDNGDNRHRTFGVTVDDTIEKLVNADEAEPLAHTMYREAWQRRMHNRRAEALRIHRPRYAFRILGSAIRAAPLPSCTTCPVRMT
jgi:hypothetical protein